MRPAFFSFLLLLAPSSGHGAKLLHLEPDEVALVSYGSLMNKESLEKSLGYAYNGQFIFTRIKGWARAWDVGMPNRAFYAEDQSGRTMPEKIAYLNIRPERGREVSCAIFVIKKSELANFNRREWIYDTVDVSKNLAGVQIEGGEVLAYVAKPEYRLPKVYAFPEVGIRATYVDTVEKALKRVPGAYEDFLATTDRNPIAPFPDQKDPTIDVFGYKAVAETGSCARQFADVGKK